MTRLPFTLFDFTGLYILGSAEVPATNSQKGLQVAVPVENKTNI